MVRMIGLLSLVACLVSASVGPAVAQADRILGAELCDAAQGVLPAGSRIALAPPPAAQSPVPVAEVEAVMSRAAQAMCADWAEKPRILAGSAELRASLALVQARQGIDAWRETVQATVRQEADYVLVGETAMAGGEVVLRLTLVDLQDGRVLVKTSDAAFGDLTRQVTGDPRATIRAAVGQFLDSMPAARTEVTVGRFVNETSGVETALGRALSEMAVEGWLDSANSVTALLRDAPPARVRFGEAPAAGYYLEGRVRLVDATRFQLVLRLSQDGGLRATRTLELSALKLPDRLQALLDPSRISGPMTLAEVSQAITTLAEQPITLTARGGYGGAFPVCRARDASRLLADCAGSLIRMDLIAENSGDLLCLSLDERGQFNLMLPSDYAPQTALSPRRPLTLPDDLPVLADGNRVYWPAMGPPAETMLACVLYPVVPDPTLKLLAGLDGQMLSPTEQGRLVSILKDSNPTAGGAVVVRIVD